MMLSAHVDEVLLEGGRAAGSCNPPILRSVGRHGLWNTFLFMPVVRNLLLGRACETHSCSAMWCERFCLYNCMYICASIVCTVQVARGCEWLASCAKQPTLRLLGE